MTQEHYTQLHQALEEIRLELADAQQGRSGRSSDRAPAPASAYVPQQFDGAWSLALDGANATFTNCDYVRGAITVTNGTLTHSITGSDGTIWLGRKTDTETGLSEIIEGPNKGDVCDLAAPADPRYMKRCLYQIGKQTTDGTVRTWIVDDLRNTPTDGDYQ